MMVNHLTEDQRCDIQNGLTATGNQSQGMPVLLLNYLPLIPHLCQSLLQ